MSYQLKSDGKLHKLVLIVERTPSWKAFGEGVNTLEFTGHESRDSIDIHVCEYCRETGRGRDVFTSISRAELVKFLEVLDGKAKGGKS